MEEQPGILDTLRAFALEEAEFFGVADLEKAAAEVPGGLEAFKAYPRALSFGIALPRDIVAKLGQREQRDVAVSYGTHGYQVVNQRLDLLASRLASRLQRLGYKVYPVPASERSNDEEIRSFFSHKLAARWAGLGWIGKSCLLVTPQYGPRVRWTTVLTDYPFSRFGIPMDPRCGNCEECTKACPTGAFTGRMFDRDEPREARFDARKCDQYFKDMEKQAPKPVCGMCVFICPHGRNIAKNAKR